MAGSEKTETGSLLRLPPPASLTVSIAIKGNSKSKYIVNWALEKFIPEGIVMFNLIHVRPTITRIPTPVGTFRLAHMREDIVNAHRKAVEWETNEKLLPYKRMCTKKKVQVEIIQIESSDVVHAISREVDNSNVNRLVIGASPRGMILRRQNVSSEIAESIQKPCTVYAVAKGKLFTMRPVELETHGSITVPISMTSSSTDESSIYNSNSQDGIAVDDFGVLHTIEEEPQGCQNQEVQNRQLGAWQNQSIQNRHLGARQTQAVQNRHLGAWQNQSIQNGHLGGWQNQAVQHRPTQMRRQNEIKPMMESLSKGEVTVSMVAGR
ncbi:hypothetical protein Vadar_010006 [Vaccinium darrowii]|uniref:Uncharacterized protein n=1 Tax=Vaccinium darrowii TaxID=229202 RepID=A0ACB7YKR1_9ERIC|nr:hypothetical protein Vadar_010006 [Vaccinium darrowii]